MKNLHFIKISLALLALVGYLSIVVFGPIHMAHMAEMNMPMEHCPFAVGEHALCKMNPFEHLKVWQQFTTTLLPFIKILSVIGILFALAYFSYRSPPITRFLFSLKRERLRTFSLYQQLFSQGILNPKAP
jgi:biotin transporter BioY